METNPIQSAAGSHSPCLVQHYNLPPDLPKPMAPAAAPRNASTDRPDDLAPLFPMSLIMQEVSTEREIEIPEEVRQLYAQWRPSPLYRARRLEKALDTPAHIYYKYEGSSPAGSHKLNTAMAQAYYNKKDGTKHLSTETGAGQWGSALSMACAFFGLDCKVYMVRVSYDQKPYRRALMEAFGATVTASPSIETESGRAILAAASGFQRLARHRHLRGRGSGRQRPQHQVRAGQRAESRAAAPDRHRPGSHRADGAGRRRAGRDYRLRRRRIELCRPGAALRRPQPQGPEQGAHRGRRTGRLPQPHQGPLHLRLRRHRPPDSAGQDAHPGQQPSFLPAFMPADCAITAWDRWSRT
jgi:hypothetical protein